MDWYTEYYEVDFDDDGFYVVDKATGQRLPDTFLDLEEAEREAEALSVQRTQAEHGAAAMPPDARPEAG